LWTKYYIAIVRLREIRQRREARSLYRGAARVRVRKLQPAAFQYGSCAAVKGKNTINRARTHARMYARDRNIVVCLSAACKRNEQKLSEPCLPFGRGGSVGGGCIVAKYNFTIQYYYSVIPNNTIYRIYNNDNNITSREDGQGT